ncbi:sulfurtransferase [Microbacterium gorillae]|uniref:sulfurtransferase n=1 Tax=Microbacterium gorillae TaxID=1231063 RepID=UPI00058C9898|nr:sulfurtransferase [Microbacterium gorillae]
MPRPLIDVVELADLLRGDTPVHLLDVRWRLDQPEGRPAYLDGHLPGAVYVDLDRELADRDDPKRGRHPVPSREALQASARRWGLRTGEPVVIYDDVQSVAAARAWLLLTRSGVADVRVLDGGLRAWIAAGFPLPTGDVLPTPGDIELAELTGTIDIDEAATWSTSGVLIDARAPERFRGDADPLNPVAGHIPGARNLPTTAHLSAGRFLDPERLRLLFAAVGADGTTPVAAYCGSGIAASHTVLAAELAGLDVALYPGSWSQWSRARGRVAAVGSAPAQDLLPI